MAGTVISQALTTLNQVLGPLQLPPDYDGAISLQLGSLGNDGVTASSGTVVLEASNNYDPQQYIGLSGQLSTPLLGIPTAGDWVIIAMKNPTTAPPSDIASLVAAGVAQYGVAENLAYRWVRARMSVVGGAHGTITTLSIGLF